MIVHSYVAEDPRVRREAEALTAAGRGVTVVGLRRPGDPERLDLGGIDVHQLDVQRHQGAGIGTYLREYLAFLARASVAAVRLHRRRRFGLVQVHSLPDFLVFAALPLRLVGVPVLLDLHEAMPEFFRSRFPRAANPLIHRALVLQERLSIAAASHTITVNDAMRDRLVRLGADPGRTGVVINSPSLSRFDVTAHPRRAFREDGRLRLIYTGALTPTYELDVALRAMARIAADRPDLDVGLDVFGLGDRLEALQALAADLTVADRVAFHGRVPIDDVPARVAAADIGLAPTRHDPFTDMSLSTKVFEYAAMGKPVVASALPMVERTFPPGTVSTYPSGDDAAMTAAILALVDDPLAREAAVQRTSAIVQEGAWEHSARGYLALVDGLIGDA
jgi:glycosyltransferase involved in cell wall biosynthesis